MGDQSFFDISEPQPCRNQSFSPWMTPQSRSSVQKQHTIGQWSRTDVNAGQNLSSFVSNSSSAICQPVGNEQGHDIDAWDPMDDDFACPTFNSYKNFDILSAERPNEKSPEKGIRQSPEKRAEEISLYVGNIPLSVTSEGIRNLFLTAGEVQSCKILPPKDPSGDTKYGFVKFCTWREAIKTIETYDGFYVGSQKNLQVRVAHRKRTGDEYFTIRGEDNSSSETDGAMQSTQENYRHPPFKDNYNFDDANTSDQNMNASHDRSSEVQHPQYHQLEVNNSNSNQHLIASPAKNLDHTEQTNISEKSPSQSNHEAIQATSREKLPCTCCKKLCTQRCSACKAPYCSRKCQKNDRARHKLVCTFQRKTKPAPKSEESSKRKPSPVHPPCQTVSVTSLDSDSDFDCIDISLDNTKASSGNISKDESKNALQSSKGSISFDSGHTSHKENASIVIANESDIPKVNAGIEMVNSQQSIVPSEMSYEKQFLAHVTAVSFVNKFWAAVRTPDYTRFCELVNQMAEITEENLERITVVDVGIPCIARFSIDNCWYRSRVIQGSGEHVEVMFIDYGNTEWKRIHDLYQLPPGFGDVPPQAKQFSLHGVAPPNRSEIEKQMIKYLEGMLCGKTFLAELVHFAPDCIPEVILRENESQETINEQIMKFLEHETSKFVKIDSSYDTSGKNPFASNPIAPVSYDNGQMASCVSDNIPPEQTINDNDTVKPMPSSASDQISPIPKAVQKARMASEVPDDILPSTKTFNIVVCNFLNPTTFWVWFQDTAKDFYPKLSSMMSETYEQSAYSDYVPVTGEIIAAKFIDGAWYRAKVDCVDKNGYLEVTFVDFGNSEKVRLHDTRMITDALFAIPKLATKCALHGMEEPARGWSTECVQFCNEFMLDKLASATVQSQDHSLVLKVNMEIDGEITSVFDEIVKQGYFISEKLKISDADSTPTSAFSEQKETVDEKPIRPSNEHVLPDSKPVLPAFQPVPPPNRPVLLPNRPVLPPNRPVLPPNRPVPPSNRPVLPHRQPVSTISQSVPPRSQPVPPFSQPVSPDFQVQSTSVKPNSPNIKPPSRYEQDALPENKLTSLTNQPFSPGLSALPVEKLVVSEKVGTTTASFAFSGSKPPPHDSKDVVLHSRPPISYSQPSFSDSKPTLPNGNLVFKSETPSNPALHAPDSTPQIILGLNCKTMLPLPAVPSTSFNVVVNDIFSADKFYVQITDPNLVKQLQKCVHDLNEYVTKTHPPKVENVTVGSQGCAKFSHDNVWYRAQVLTISDGGNLKVRFIDFGNIENVRPEEFLKPPEFFYHLAPQAICCQLGMSGQYWGEESRNMMKMFTLNQQLSCTVHAGTTWPKYSVKLQKSVGDQVVDIEEELRKVGVVPCRSKTASPSSQSISSSHNRSTTSPCSSTITFPHSTSTPSSCVPSCKHQRTPFSDNVLSRAILSSGIGEIGVIYTVIVAAVFHPTYFWVQNALNLENIERLQSELDSYYTKSSYPPLKPVVNSFYVYIHRDHCYRVFLRNVTPKGLLLHCVDFGFQMLADETFLRPLEDRFRNQPFGAILCSIMHVQPMGGRLWTDEATLYFRNKLKSRKVKMRVTFNSQVRLFVDVFCSESGEEYSLRKALIANGLATEYQGKAMEYLSYLEGSHHKLAGSESTTGNMGQVHPNVLGCSSGGR